MTNRIAPSVLVLSLLSSTLALGAESAATVPASAANPTEQKLTTKIEAPAPKDSVLDRLNVIYFTIYHGSTLTDTGARNTVDSNGKLSKTFTQNFDGDLSATYLMNQSKSAGIGPVIPFILYPTAGEKNAVLGDVGLRALDRKWITSGDFTMGNALVFQLPTYQPSIDRGMSFSLKITPTMRYVVPRSNFVLGAYNESRAYFGVTKGKTFKLLSIPYVAYNLSDSVALNVAYEMEVQHLMGNPNLDLTSYQNDLMPGVVVKIAPRFMINPYVQIFTANRIATDSIALGALISATLL